MFYPCMLGLKSLIEIYLNMIPLFIFGFARWKYSPIISDQNWINGTLWNKNYFFQKPTWRIIIPKPLEQHDAVPGITALLMAYKSKKRKNKQWTIHWKSWCFKICFFLNIVYKKSSNLFVKDPLNILFIHLKRAHARNNL